MQCTVKLLLLYMCLFVGVTLSNKLDIAVSHRLISWRATFHCCQMCWLLVSSRAIGLRSPFNHKLNIFTLYYFSLLLFYLLKLLKHLPLFFYTENSINYRSVDKWGWWGLKLPSPPRCWKGPTALGFGAHATIERVNLGLNWTPPPNPHYRPALRIRHVSPARALAALAHPNKTIFPYGLDKLCWK